MEEPMVEALRITRDQISFLKVAEAAFLAVIGGEPMSGTKSDAQKIAGAVLAALRGEPAPDPRPRRVVIGGSGRKAGPLRGWVAELLDTRGPLTVPEMLSLKPELDKRKTYNLVTSCPWFERVPDLYPATYQLSDRGREEYAKAKAEEKAHEATSEN